MQAKAKTKTFKAAVIGCGMIGSGLDRVNSIKILTHAKGYKQHDSCDLVACVDRNLEAIERFRQKWGEDIRGYQDIEEMLASEAPEIVSVCTPTENHVADVKKIYQHSSVKVVICEKPLTDSMDELDELKDIIRNSSKVFVVNYMRCFDPAHQEAVDIVQSGQLGKPVGFHGVFTKGLYHNGSHLLALIEDVCGEIIQFEVVDAERIAGDVYGTYIARTASGVTGTLFNTSGDNYALFELDVILEGGRVVFSELGGVIKVCRPEKSADFDGYNELKYIYIPENTIWYYGLNSISYAISLLKYDRKRKALIDRQLGFSRRMLRFRDSL